MSLQGMLYVDIIEGSYMCLLDQMNPFPASNSVIVMDNCQIHHADFILKMIEDRFVLVHDSFVPH